MALNLVRNSRVFFTTNVNSSTGVINSSGFSTGNTQEIQVLDGFTFSQNTNSETITVSEAGSDPIRGQRSFNTSLAPVDFSFSTYVRPSNASTYITAEEAGLWNALLSASDTTKYDIGSVTGVTYVSSTGIVTIAGTALTGTTSIAVGDIITLTGITAATNSKYINAACKVTASAANGITATLVNPPPAMADITTIANPGTLSVYKSAWAPATSSYSTATAATSNKNQLQKFGMIFVVDNVTYAVDNCAMNQVTVDFGLDAIATLAWTGQATALRDASLLISLTASAGATSTVSGLVSTITGLASTDNLFQGQTIVTAGGTAVLGTSVTITSITSSSSIIVTATSGTPTAGTITGLKVLVSNATGTLAAPTGTGPWISDLTGLTTVVGVSVGDTITAVEATALGGGNVSAISGTGPWSYTLTLTAGTTYLAAGDTITATVGTGSLGTGTSVVATVSSDTTYVVTVTGGTTPVNGAVAAVIATSPGNFGTGTGGTAVVSAITSATALKVSFSGGNAPQPGAVKTIVTTVANLSASTALIGAAKITTAPFITNKLSTVTFKTLNALGNAAAGSYAIALTGGSLTINNNIAYVTPANLGTVNIPATYYTGTRAISGSMNAYLKTGLGVGSTGQLLADMLAAATASTEPMASLSIAIGGSTAATRVEFDMPAVTFSIPTIDVQQVVSTVINFTAEGSVPNVLANANTFAVDAVNDLTVRYYSA